MPSPLSLAALLLALVGATAAPHAAPSSRGTVHLTTLDGPAAAPALVARLCGVPPHIGPTLTHELKQQAPEILVLDSVAACSPGAPILPLIPACGAGRCRVKWAGDWDDWTQHPTPRFAAAALHAHLHSAGFAPLAANDVGERATPQHRPNPLPSVAAAFLVILALVCQTPPPARADPDP